MIIPAWQVITWDRVDATLAVFERTIPRLRHLGTTVDAECDESEARHGQTLWAGELEGRRLGIAWDWTEVRVDLYALTDPLRILSNVDLREDGGVPLAEGRRILYLNSALHGLPWQRTVPARRARGARCLAA